MEKKELMSWDELDDGTILFYDDDENVVHNFEKVDFVAGELIRIQNKLFNLEQKIKGGD